VSDKLVDETGLNCNFELDHWNKAHGILAAAINNGMPLLRPEALGLGYSEPIDAKLRQRILHVFELDGLITATTSFIGWLPHVTSVKMAHQASALASNIAKMQLGDQELCHVQLLIRCVSRTDDLPGTLRRLRAADEELVEK